jgi:hypothetical protein
MSPDTVDMDTRRRLADRVDQQLKRDECETGIDWFQTDERATVTSYSPSIVRQLLRHREARLCWVYATGGNGATGRVQNPSQLLGSDASVEGVQVTVPVGTLGIKGSVRSTNKDSDVVHTPEDADDAREAFTDGGQYRLPSVGDRVVDREGGHDLVVIDVHPGTGANSYHVDGDATVADHNEAYDPAAPVVECIYVNEAVLAEWRDTEGLRRSVDVDDLSKYSFPADRLAPAEEDDQ